MPFAITASVLVAGALALLSSCATPHQHGAITDMSVAKSHDWKACEHHVPSDVCVQCHPEKAAAFKSHRDWCPEHNVPESQCLKCHPDLDFSPPKKPPPEADVIQLVQAGEDLEALEPHLVPGKFTVFDFHADWCTPCKKVSEFLFKLQETRADIAVRKLNLVSWESPLAERWLRDIPELPFIVVYGPSGEKLASLHGAKLKTLNELLTQKPK